MIAPANPTPWLILFASSSPVDCVHLGKTIDSSTTFIITIMQRASSNWQFEISGSAMSQQRLQSSPNQPSVDLSAFMATTNQPRSIEAISFDAVGTLFE